MPPSGLVPCRTTQGRLHPGRAAAHRGSFHRSSCKRADAGVSTGNLAERETWGDRIRPLREAGGHIDEQAALMTSKQVLNYSPAWRSGTKVGLPPLIKMLMKRDWHGYRHFPAEGGMIWAANTRC